jgi:chromosome segregation protein
MSDAERGHAPARLLSVRLQGFKSFADRTHVTFGPGISAVVGPNGSGKSNLADALRWALGEQGRALRSRKSEDVIWAGSDKRPAVGMADVQLTLDNEDGLLPVEYGAVELGRRLYRSGENDYLLNRQRVRLRDLVDLLDSGHLAENAFLFIGQGMVDQALSLRPEERRGLFEEVAGVRRHERRRRRAEEQLAESESNLARVEDILAELRPQARRLAQQAEQQANRLTAAEELASGLLLSAHARWHVAAGRATGAAHAFATARTLVDGAMAELLEQEQAITGAGAALAGQASAEAAARTDLDRVRTTHSAVQLRESRHASEVDAAARDRVRLDETRTAADADLAAARQELALPLPHAPADLEAELATLDAEIASARSGAAAASDAEGIAGMAGLSAVDAAAVRRLEAAREQERVAARRRAAEAERVAADERARANLAAAAAATALAERSTASAALEAARAGEAAAIEAREAAQADVAEAESSARSAADRVAGARAAVAAAAARHEDARRALDAAEGGGFSKAARARGGRAIGDGLIIDPALQPAVNAALAGLGRAQVMPRAEISAVAAERGVAIPSESVAGEAVPAPTDAEGRLIDAARARGGGRLVDAVRRDDARAVTRLLHRVVWLPDAAGCLEIQDSLLAGWLAVARDGSVAVGEVATWLRPDGRGLHLRGDAERLAAELAAAEATTRDADAERESAETLVAAARAMLARAREAESNALVARRRAEESERGAVAAAESAGRDAAWAAAQADRLDAEAARLRSALPVEAAADAGAGDTTVSTTTGTGDGDAAKAAEARERRLAELQRQRSELAAEVDSVRISRLDAERRRARAEAAASLAERQLTGTTRSAGDLAEREARLASEREALVEDLARAARDVADAEAALAAVSAAASSERDRLRAAEATASAARERVRIAQERARIDERDDVEARLALEGLREQLLVELAALGPTALHLLGARPAEATLASEESAAAADLEPEVLEAALTNAATAWAAKPPAGDPPNPARLATLRRRFHELGAVNPFAADEYAEVKARLDGLEVQHADLQSAIDHTRALIRELDTLIADQFRRTFEALERAFDERFQQLFGGGYARLSLTDPDDLAATGIEITARPPGKKAQALAMLSGGERALTAVALLFAMLKVRPVPFCVLDEVDAALDEANIGRFTDALRELSRGTQCIVITHNRGTIETADALYGVTVGDDSVSRVISLRLDEATALARRGSGASARADRPAAEPAEMPAGVTPAGVE